MNSGWFLGEHASSFGRLVLSFANRYIIKPISGAGSEAVFITDAVNIGSVIQNARNYLAKCYPSSVYRDRSVSVDGLEVNLFTDLLVEEYLTGPEFTVDGFVSGGDVTCVVQHKETRVVGEFIGDGLILSPPDFHRNLDQVYRINDAHLQISESCNINEKIFKEFLTAGLRALEIDNWPFHAEVIAVGNELRFAELNARPAGGLLWYTCGLHLGMDPFDFGVRQSLGHGKVRIARRKGIVTGQFPIYAQTVGKFERICGIDEGLRDLCVDRIEVVATPGQPITSLEKENYLAFVALKANSHAELRKAWRRLSQHLKPEIRSE